MPRDLTPRAKCRGAAAFWFDLFRAYLATLVMAAPCWSEPTGAAADVHGPEASGAQPSAPSAGFWKWFDPETAPFLPVPEIATNPNGGTTIGILPVWLRTDEHHVIRRIIAPDFLHSPYFGFGFHARMYSYPSQDEQWSLLAGAKQRIASKRANELHRGTEPGAGADWSEPQQRLAAALHRTRAHRRCATGHTAGHPFARESIRKR